MKLEIVKRTTVCGRLLKPGHVIDTKTMNHFKRVDANALIESGVVQEIKAPNKKKTMKKNSELELEPKEEKGPFDDITLPV